MINVNTNVHEAFNTLVKEVAKKIDEPYFLVQNWFISIVLSLVDLDEVAKEIKKAIERSRAPEPQEPKAIPGKTGSK